LQYNPQAAWYEWTEKRAGRLQICRTNDVAYGKHVRKTAGLHEQHLAEELHRYSVFPAQYTDNKGTVSVDPSVPPMGDPFRFHGAVWTGKRFDDMWAYWTRLYPAHAHDIERELFNSKTEIRKAWWDVKFKSVMKNGNSVNVPLRVIETLGKNKDTWEKSSKKTGRVKRPLRVFETLRKNKDTMRRGKGHFELTYLDLPCKICGGGDHPAMREREDDYGIINYEYICKLAANDDWESLCMRPCPEKLARECLYDEYEVEKVWTRLIIDGWGQNQKDRINGEFLKMAKFYCKRKGVLTETTKA